MTCILLCPLWHSDTPWPENLPLDSAWPQHLSRWKSRSDFLGFSIHYALALRGLFQNNRENLLTAKMILPPKIMWHHHNHHGALKFALLECRIWKHTNKFSILCYIEIYWSTLYGFLSMIFVALGFLSGSEDKASACSAGDQSSIPGSGRSPGEGNGNPRQYSCLENPMDGGAW